MMAMFNNKKLFILANIMFASIFSFPVYSQYENSYFSKFGINISSDYIKAENEQNAVQYEYKNVYTYNFGLNYKLLLGKNSDVVFSVQLRNYNMTNKSDFKGVDIPDPQGYSSEMTVYDFKQYKILATYDLYFLNTKKIVLYAGLGPEVLIYPDDPITGVSIFTADDGTEIGYTESGSSGNSPFFGINSSIGLQLKTKQVLINPYFLYHYQSTDLFTNVVTTQNLLTSENTVSTHILKGSYISFGINFYPRKDIFKKKP